VRAWARRASLRSSFRPIATPIAGLWLAAGIDDLRPAPLRDLTGRGLAVIGGKAKPTATLQVTA